MCERKAGEQSFTELMKADNFEEILLQQHKLKSQT